STDSLLVTSRSRSVTPSWWVVAPEAFRLVPTTSKPASTSASAAASPIPEDAPVTSATGRAPPWSWWLGSSSLQGDPDGTTLSGTTASARRRRRSIAATAVAKPLLDGASRTRTGDLLGAITPNCYSLLPLPLVQAI